MQTAFFLLLLRHDNHYSPTEQFCRQKQHNRSLEWDDVRTAFVKFPKAVGKLNFFLSHGTRF